MGSSRRRATKTCSFTDRALQNVAFEELHEGRKGVLHGRPESERPLCRERQAGHSPGRTSSLPGWRIGSTDGAQEADTVAWGANLSQNPPGQRWSSRPHGRQRPDFLSRVPRSVLPWLRREWQSRLPERSRNGNNRNGSIGSVTGLPGNSGSRNWNRSRRNTATAMFQPNTHQTLHWVVGWSTSAMRRSMARLRKKESTALTLSASVGSGKRAATEEAWRTYGEQDPYAR